MTLRLLTFPLGRHKNTRCLMYLTKCPHICCILGLRGVSCLKHEFCLEIVNSRVPYSTSSRHCFVNFFILFFLLNLKFLTIKLYLRLHEKFAFTFSLNMKNESLNGFLPQTSTDRRWGTSLKRPLKTAFWLKIKPCLNRLQDLGLANVLKWILIFQKNRFQSILHFTPINSLLILWIFKNRKFIF